MCVFFLSFFFRLLCSVSPTGRLQAQLRNVPGSKGKEDKQFLEVKMSRTLLNKMISEKDYIFLFKFELILITAFAVLACAK